MSTNGGIAGWIVQTARGIHGPFASAGEAATYIDVHFQNLTGPFALLPMHEPRTLPSGRSIKDAIRELNGKRREPFDDGWSPSA